jgi:hypothetical protein
MYRRPRPQQQAAKTWEEGSLMPITDYVLKPGCGYRLVSSKVTKNKDKSKPEAPVYNKTLIKILPSIAEDGVALEDMVMYPDETSPQDKMGDWLVSADVLKGCGTTNASILGGTYGYSEAGELQDEADPSKGAKLGWLDRQGRAVSYYMSPLQRVVRNIYIKLLEAKELLNVKVQPDVPAKWLKWLNMDCASCSCSNKSPLGNDFISADGRPISLSGPGIREVMVRCIVYQENGVKLDTPELGVLIIPRNAVTAFLRNLLRPAQMISMDEEGIATFENNKFGNIGLGGNLVVLTAYTQINAAQGSTKVEYTLEDSGLACPISLDYLKQVYRTWDEILLPAAIEDVLETLVKVYSPEAVDFALRNVKQYSPYLEYLNGDTPVIGTSENISDPVYGAKDMVAKGVHPLQRNNQQVPGHNTTQTSTMPPPTYTDPNAAVQRGPALPPQLPGLPGLPKTQQTTATPAPKAAAPASLPALPKTQQTTAAPVNKAAPASLPGLPNLPSLPVAPKAGQATPPPVTATRSKAQTPPPPPLPMSIPEEDSDEFFDEDLAASMMAGEIDNED